MGRKTKADFEGVVTFCEIIHSGDGGDTVYFDLELEGGKKVQLSCLWASFRLHAGERVRAWKEDGWTKGVPSLETIEVVNSEGAVTFRW